MKLETANDGVKERDTAPFIAEGSSHLVRMPPDFFKKTLGDVVGPNGLPVFTREGIKRQAGVQITLEAVDGRGIDLPIFLDKSGHFPVGSRPLLLREDGFSLTSHLLALFGWHVTQDILHLMDHAALSGRFGKLSSDSV